ncbi:MAG: class I SAM-dependent methyltransferase [Acidobacteriota bacterium]|jgi:SAM-dependent methyltransferase
MSTTAKQVSLTRPQKRPAWMRNFSHPRGVVGSLVGHLMAYKNAPLNRAAVELLGVQPDDDVLEIGFGPGTAIAMIAALAPRGTVAGIDISARMVQQAMRRNRTLIAAGRVDLRQASAAAIPFADASFARVIAVNNFHRWPDRAAGLGETLRVLRPGGTLMLAQRGALANAGAYTPPGLDDAAVRRVVAELHDAGFEDVRTERVAAGRELVAVIGRRPAAD